MLIVLTVCLVIASILIFFEKKTRESIWLLGLCLSLMFEICGIMIFIAKKGGISQEVLQFFYFSKEIQNKIQYFLISLGQMGYLVACGRTLYPFFLIQLAMSYSMIAFIRKNPWIEKLAAIPPAITLILYFPALYRYLTECNALFQQIINKVTLFWMTVYIVISGVLLLLEFKSITMKFCKRQFAQILTCLLALTAIYFLYYQQDPGQIYRFYQYYDSWNKGIGYMRVSPSGESYYTLVIIRVVGSVLGFYSLFRFTSRNYVASKEDIVMERKFDTAKIGASMFVHSMKNELIANKIIFKRIDQLYEQPEPDSVKLKEYVDTLEEINGTLLLRIEELYSCVKSNAIYMVPVSMSVIAQDAVERFHGKYPQVEIQVDLGDNPTILVDKVHFCEALYNLLINAREAVAQTEEFREREIALLCHTERLYTVIEVRDNGMGIDKRHVKKIFDPFYSSKNSNSNWGMGLYYVMKIVKSHLGFLRVESTSGKGSSFFIMLPKYQ